MIYCSFATSVGVKNISAVIARRCTLIDQINMCSTGTIAQCFRREIQGFREIKCTRSML